jgi:lysophospholipase L1-like esterase
MKMPAAWSKRFHWMVPGALFAALGLLFTGCRSIVNPAAVSQAPGIAEANETAPVPAAKIQRTLPVLFIVGDSTVHNSAPGLLGWGDVVGRYFDTNKIIVENHAKPGRSSRTFQTQGWWAQILAAGQPGDFVLIQMGHNDGGPLDDTNRARGTIRGVGDETREIYNPVMRQREIVHTYGWYMRKYVADARARGMVPIICSPVPRLPERPVAAGDVDKSTYGAWAAEVAQSEHAFFIGLNQIVLDHYAGMTPPEIKAKYFTKQDNTHFNPAGAELNAASVVAGLRALKDCPLNAFLLIGQDKPAPLANE